MDRSNHNIAGFGNISDEEKVDIPGTFVTLTAQGTYYQERSVESDQLNDTDSEGFVRDLNQKSKQLSHVTWLGIIPMLILTIVLLYNSFDTQQITQQPAVNSINAEITNYDGLNVRQLPNAKSPILRSVKYGDKFPLLDSTNIKWLKIALHGSVGYVSKAFSIIRHNHTDAVIENRTYMSNKSFPYECIGGLLFFIFLISWLNKIDRRRMEIAIFYDIDNDLEPVYEKFSAFFSELASSAKIWQHTGTKPNLNLKSSGGALNLINRFAIAFIAGHKNPVKFFKTNVQIPNIKLQNTELFFLPERLLIKRNNNFIAVAYQNLKITAQTARFIENETVPMDAQVVDRTWQHMNKKGGPDRRFANNKQMSVCAYSDYYFYSNSGINEVISTSKKGAADNFANLLLQIGRLQAQVDLAKPVAVPQTRPIVSVSAVSKIETVIIAPPPITVAVAEPKPEIFREVNQTGATPFEPSKENDAIVELTTIPAPIKISEICDSVALAKIAPAVQVPVDVANIPDVIDVTPFESPKENESIVDLTTIPAPIKISEIVYSVADARLRAPIQAPVEIPKTTNVIDMVPGDVKLNLSPSVGFTTPTNFISSSNQVYQGYNSDDYKLGSKYKTKLSLSPQEVLWLNKFMHYVNAFNGIEGCAVAVINLYLATIKKMVRRFANEPVGLQQRMEDIKNAAYKFSMNQPNQWGYYDHSQVKEATEADLYYTVYKKAESAVREAWESGRSISPAFNSRSQEAIELFKCYTEPMLNEVILELIPAIPAPDEATEIELNQKNSTRWKRQFERTIGGSIRDTKAMVKEIHHLAKLNKKNPSIENIYYEAAKFMAPVDKIEALNMYLYYIKADQKSARIDNKPFNKTNQKQLFKTPEQQAEFQTIIEELSVLKDIKQSLKKVAVFYEPKRKRITLDNSAIELAGQELSGTVDVLNKYLKEEDEPEPAVHEVNTQSPAIAVPTDAMVATDLNVLQLALLALFKNSNFSLSSDAVISFAQQHGAFKNQLIESINEICIDVLDDVLIEEGEEEYTIDPVYFRKIYPA